MNGCRSSLHRLINFLHHYETVSSQLINQANSSFYVRGQTSVSLKTIVQSITSFQPRQFPFTYLGCPVYVGGVQIRHFDDMIRKIRGRISRWDNWLLFFGGKLVLIWHVLSSMPLHLFHVLWPPATVIQILERLFTKFLWSDTDSRWCINWCRWSSVCFPVVEGGLGVRSFSSLADAFEMKL